MQVEWTPEPRAGRLGEHARDVVEGSDPVEPEVSPSGIDRGVYYTRQARLFFLVGHVGPVPAHFPPDQRVAVRSNGLGVWRDINPGSVRAHLVVVNVSLWNPVAEQELRHVLRLRHVGLEGVAVVIVSDVLVVKDGKTGALELRSYILVVPVGDQYLAVRIEARNHDGDRVVQDSRGLFVCALYQFVDQFRGHLAGGHFRGVKSHRLYYDHFALSDEAFDFGLG